jgi:hypothetical protein
MPGGPKPSPQRRVARAFIDAIDACRTPRYILARQAGWPIDSQLSWVLTRPGAISATPLLVQRLRLLASLVGFSPEAIFEVDGDAIPVVGLRERESTDEFDGLPGAQR